MKVKVIAGIRHVEISDPLCGAWIEFVSFPMVVTNYEADSADDPEEITLHNEGELIAWAEATFEPEGYEVWDMDVPANVTTAVGVLHQRLESLDREITAANDAGYPTAGLTAALDELRRELSGGRVAIPATLLEEAASGLEESAARHEEDAHELKDFPAEAEFVSGYSARAKELRTEAETLRAWATGCDVSGNSNEPVAIVAIDGGNVHNVETKGGAVIEVSDHDKHSDEPLIVSRYRGTQCISQQVLEER